MSDTFFIEMKVPVIQTYAPYRYVEKIVPVEVLTVHFKTNTMRIRYRWEDFIGSGAVMKATDVDAGAFFEKYEIVKKC